MHGPFDRSFLFPVGGVGLDQYYKGLKVAVKRLEEVSVHAVCVPQKKKRDQCLGHECRRTKGQWKKFKSS